MSTTDPKPKAAPLWPRLLVAFVLLAAIGLALRPRISRWLRARGPHAQGSHWVPAPPVRPAATHPHDGVNRPAASPEVLAFLAPITVGSSLGGAEVASISGVHLGLIHVVLRNGGERYGFAIGLSRPDREAQRAGPYAVYIWAPGRSAETTAALTEALVRSLRAHLGRPAPPGLSGGDDPTTATLLPPPRVTPPTDAALPTSTATVGPGPSAPARAR